jgi:hypothetical protein
MRAGGWCALASVCAVLLPVASATAAPVGEPYGIVGFTAHHLPGETLAQRTASYSRLYDAGVRVIRLDIGWTQVEPPGQPLRDYGYRGIDREVEAIRRAGLTIIGLLAYGHPDYSVAGGAVQTTPIAGGLPPLGTGSAHHFPPDDPADFARYARATAAHYGDVVTAWEVWNEENAGVRFWPPREDPRAYTELLCRTYPELKAVDPATPVLYGGLFFPGVPGTVPITSGPDFLEASYRANPELGRCFDTLAYHPYAYPFTSPEVEVPIRGSLLSAYRQLQGILRRHGDAGKPLWITEAGWPTNDRAYGVSEVKQAQYVARMQAASFAQRVPLLNWYTYGDAPDPSGGYDQEAAFGFFRVDGTPKPAWRALATFTQVFRGTRFRRDRSRELGLPPGEPNAGGRGFALEFGGPRTTVTALWLASESATEAQGGLGEGEAAPHAQRLPVRSRRVTAVDYLGSRRRLSARGGAVSLELGPGPVYVVERRAAGRPRLRLRLRLRYRRGRTQTGRRCARSRVRATVTGRDRRLIRAVGFYLGRKRMARDRRAPFSRIVDRRGHVGRSHRHRVAARVALRDGRRTRLRAVFRTCRR